MANHATGLQLSQFNVNGSLDCQSDHFKCQSTSANSRDPVAIVQLHLWMGLIGRFPIYREATDQPGPAMNSTTSFSQSGVTQPLDSHSDQVGVNG